MSYYPIPDIPADASPALRRFCEQVRTGLSRLEAHGQNIEVHHAFCATPSYAIDFFSLLEFPVYRADVPVELMYATWTVPVSTASVHNLRIFWRPPDGQATRVLMQELRADSVTTTAWIRYVPKRFETVTRGKRILNAQILTLEVEDTADEVVTFPWGLLSLYLRKATDN